jgi:hypothetical protein
VPNADGRPVERMRAIAKEFNQSETTFLVRPTRPAPHGACARSPRSGSRCSGRVTTRWAPGSGSRTPADCPPARRGRGQ